ncbi:hypothetical protein SNEBB_009708 [Seison nebaliae]|nr:hypothetical protein SNEBB_009708 [Seison nebaliae]
MWTHVAFYFCLFNVIFFKSTECAFKDECSDCTCDVKCNSDECRECLEKVGVDYNPSEDPVDESLSVIATNSQGSNNYQAPKPAAVPSLTSGDLSQECLDCMCEKKSECKPLKCKPSGCGYYQISEPFYVDCGRPGNSFEECAVDRTCSDQCIKAYMQRYGKYCAGHDPLSCSVYARVLNGGPQGCQNPSTAIFGQEVDKCAADRGG